MFHLWLLVRITGLECFYVLVHLVKDKIWAKILGFWKLYNHFFINLKNTKDYMKFKNYVYEFYAKRFSNMIILYGVVLYYMLLYMQPCYPFKNCPPFSFSCVPKLCHHIVQPLYNFSFQFCPSILSMLHVSMEFLITPPCFIRYTSQLVYSCMRNPHIRHIRRYLFSRKDI